MNRKAVFVCCVIGAIVGVFVSKGIIKTLVPEIPTDVFGSICKYIAGAGVALGLHYFTNKEDK